jgi:hypothetical protein
MSEETKSGLTITVLGKRLDVPKDTQFVIVKRARDGSLEFTGTASNFNVSWCSHPESIDKPLDAEVYAQELRRLGYGVEVRLQP